MVTERQKDRQKDRVTFVLLEAADSQSPLKNENQLDRTENYQFVSFF